MQTEKKITKEDTWKPADLRRHILDGGQGDDRVRRRDENERRHRGGESVERRHRDPEKAAWQERNKRRESDSTGERGKQKEREKDRYQEKRKESSRDRGDDRVERDREKRRERERVADTNKQGDKYRENRERRHDRDGKETQERERDQERSRDKERERVRERERGDQKGRDKRREERDRERRREERDRERRTEGERKSHEVSEEGMTERERKHDREQRDREKRDRHRDREHVREWEPHKDDLYNRRSDRERRERHADRNFSEQKEERGYKEERRKEQRERRHKERGQHDERHRYGSEARERVDQTESDRHHRDNRDQAEQERHRERRHRQEADAERSHRDKTSAKTPASDRSHGDKIKTSLTKEVVVLSEPLAARVTDLRDAELPGENVEELAEDQDYGDQEYEDDFEDYEEDFEELDESAGENEPEREPHHPQVSEGGGVHSAQPSEEIKAIRRAMDEENKRVGTAQTKQSISSEEDDKPVLHTESDKVQNRGSQHGKFIDFVAAKQRQVHKKVANKQKKRSTELFRLIDLDFSVTFSHLDLPPVSEYDMYIKTFGNTNTKQAYVQCNEDNTDRDIQTEEIELCEKWTQHPAERNGACGNPHLSQEARDRSTADINIDSQRLLTFLRSASQVMTVLLEEEHAERQSLLKPRTHTDALSFSDGSLQFNTKLPFLYGRQVSLMLFSEVKRHTMLSVHSPTAEPSAVRLDSYTIICIWNIWEPSRPQKILVYESEVRCCCFSPGKATLVFAGTSVGSVVLWDLREHSSNHYCLGIGDDEWTLRHPTFSTDAVLATSGHLSSVSSVEVVPSIKAAGMRSELPLLAYEDGSLGLSFQLASLDKNGVLNLWVVVELPKASDTCSQTDLGLRPGGKVKLLHSSSLLTAERTSTRSATKTGPSQTLLLKFQPDNSNSFFIGTNMSLVSHGTTHGLKTLPKFYRSQEAGVQPADVTSIHFSPFKQNLFLVGCGDGRIRLHTVTHEQPVAEWRSSTAGEPVVSVQWGQTRPTLFCVLDAASTLYIWDLLENDREPVITERMTANRLTAMAVFGDSGQQATYSGIALACESGKIEVQYFTRRFSVPDTAEEKLERMINEGL
ncbi:cytoplasmic dynein 2 intermediate chain 1 [Lampris incognitus]|uniref:cytoplasmic dynein 2 intermediate chain 1 n=1 Tax=Lampris incognitus TaxID=2546036 RepID=UPI0024B4FEFF|nr:cytoplasmic dynein 2 intermediate chain 1 [Lampris incognitus]